MAHFAKIENQIVTQVIVADSLEWCEQNLGGEWLQTSYNNSIRKNFAGVGMRYDVARDAFIHPQPFNSWLLNDNCVWVAPIDYPQDGKVYEWNETLGAWVEAAFK